MSLVAGRVTVTVPATSANLGPGFDSLGLALGLHDTLHAEVIAGGLEIEVTGAGADSVPRDESHLVVRSMRQAFAVLGENPSGLRLTCENVIPHARGLGSSSAAIVGGLALARALVRDGRERLTDDELFELAAEIEGHPDNVAPAVYGGFTISGNDDAFYAVTAPVDERLSAVVFIPPTGVETKVARGLLPAEVPHADAAANSGRAALMVAALGFAPDQLHRATRDYLHQDYRRPAMPESLALVDALRADGIAAIVSGAGPTVLAFVVENADELLARTPAGWVSHHLRIDTAGVRASLA
ncbi:homoserine kinase [Nocardioides baekrokdamisoli]|uniref:Homoserine kinase n=1 Tax=Nocardioides baekrokdamisoli TaxID=1804624 RepID=A0A3G9IYH1_9ACTN|nr:homoserine kinase [Nocardioides baekrokdamisoli]BBH16358.1 homoserine kinase [Nocardioides baekrokdamisoli]